jgi:hypothetical protein
LPRRLWEVQLKRSQDEERNYEASRQRFEEERGRLEERERELETRRREPEEQKKEQERLAREEAAKQKAEADALEDGAAEAARPGKGFVAQQAFALAELR